MFIAKQFNKQMQAVIIAEVADTREELEKLIVGYEQVTIEETDIEYELYIGEYLTKDEIAQKQREARIAEIKKELEDIDAKSIRPLRDGDEEYLARYREQAGQLREELRGLVDGN